MLCSGAMCTGAGGLCVILQSMDRAALYKCQNAMLQTTLPFSLNVKLAIASSSLPKVIMSRGCCMLSCAFLTNTHFSADVTTNIKSCRISVIVPSLQHSAQFYCALQDSDILSVKYLRIKLGWRVCSFVGRV